MSALVVNPKRKFTFKSDKNDDMKFSISFKFPSAEDMDFTDLENYKDGEGNVNEQGSRKVVLRTIRQAIVSWTGIELEDGSPLEVDHNTEDQSNVRAVMDVLLTKEKLFKRIMDAYKGLSTKN